MRTFAVIVIIILILSLFVICENNCLNKFCNKMQINITLIDKMVGNNETENMIDKIIAYWNEQKNILFAFVNHNSFKEIESDLFNLRYNIYNGNTNKTRYHLEKLKYKLYELKKLNEFNLSNIL